MSKNKTTQIDSFKDLQAKIEDFKQKRDDSNNKTKDFIKKLQKLDDQINEALKLARGVYKKKRDS